ncbi:putative Angiomotin [Hypsibius exemplaris]|uniref:Angiomotin n=1 Tax=Hypsibius exemplaris TaxID=2072580 RepID=A0A9X6NK75_HYPEX|nr:putative Angiomotin [Hypsibius exemplaris]
MEQRKRLQSVSLESFNHFPDHLAAEVLVPPRRNTETISFDDLKHLDFEQSNILKHLTHDLRAPPTARNTTNPHLPTVINAGSSAINASSTVINAGPTANNTASIPNGSRVQPDLTRSLTPSPKNSSDSNISYETLRDENILLRQELDALTKKVGKMFKLEAEVDKIHQSYLLLLNATEKRERLENAMKAQLEREKQGLQLENQQLREQLELQIQNGSHVREEEFNNVVRNYKMTVQKLTSKNKELAEDHKRQEIELAAQKATLDEQRNHIRILDSALLNAQENVAKLKEDLTRPQLPQKRFLPTNGLPPGVSNSQRQQQPSEESVGRPTSWHQKLSSDSLNVGSNHSSTERLRSVEELNANRPLPVDVSSQIKTTSAPRVDVAVAVSKSCTPSISPARAFGPAGHRTSFPNLTVLANNGSPGRAAETQQPTNHQRPKSAASVVRETKTEQWLV